MFGVIIGGILIVLIVLFCLEDVKVIFLIKIDFKDNRNVFNEGSSFLLFWFDFWE